MSTRAFDDKFGAEFLATVPTGPGVYRYLNEAGDVLYVGKAKNLRRRLGSYRNASRKRVHRKMRTIVRLASQLDIEPLDSEEAALLREGELIRSLRPPHNVEGAYSFLYPSIAFGLLDKRLVLGLTTEPEAYAELGFRFFGCFRSRLRAKAAYDGLSEILGLLGHREKSTRLATIPRRRGSRWSGFRQVPPEIIEALPAFLAGEERSLPGQLARLLLAHPRARREAATMQEHLQALLQFFERDAARLAEALRVLGLPAAHVAGEERDALFVRAGFASAT
ncbi:MAG TPA: GIY-YIG nuclease family protein [Polyangiaceae bacterium]|nr:GIY-YIG nuclease family protein [Polyangiaceae bacterium]